MTAALGPKAAKERRPVRVRSTGQVGRLVYWPISGLERRSKQGSKGARARLQLASGRWVSANPEDLEPIPEADET